MRNLNAGIESRIEDLIIMLRANLNKIRVSEKTITAVKFGYSEKATKFEKNLPLKI